MYDRCRQALRLQLDLLAESDYVYKDVDSGDGAGTAAGSPARVRDRNAEA